MASTVQIQKQTMKLAQLVIGQPCHCLNNKPVRAANASCSSLSDIFVIECADRFALRRVHCKECISFDLHSAVKNTHY